MPFNSKSSRLISQHKHKSLSLSSLTLQVQHSHLALVHQSQPKHLRLIHFSRNLSLCHLHLQIKWLTKCRINSIVDNSSHNSCLKQQQIREWCNKAIILLDHTWLQLLINSNSTLSRWLTQLALKTFMQLNKVSRNQFNKQCRYSQLVVHSFQQIASNLRLTNDLRWLVRSACYEMIILQQRSKNCL